MNSNESGRERRVKEASVRNRLAEVRKSRGVSAADLARRVGVSRQAIYAIEAGTYVPNTEVSLRLSRDLAVSVDELFSLDQGPLESSELLAAEVLSAAPPVVGQPVRVCRIDARWIGVPVSASPYYLPEADGVIRTFRRAGKSELDVASNEDASRNRMVVAGCDPAMGLLARMVERDSGTDIVSAPASSRLALQWLKEGKVHIAGSHLEDPETGEFNLPFICREFRGEDIRVVTFARWEEGLLVRHGNPKGIRNLEHLARKNVSIVNREPGSGSRALLDRLLVEAGMEANKIRGHDHIAPGHLAAAYSLVSGEADACIATRSAARAFGLDFVPLQSERYDFVFRASSADLPPVRSFLDTLQRAAVRRKLENLAGYDTSQMGSLLM